jgi:outer membrane protein OmpA-like peptidoglycan-associated protein
MKTTTQLFIATSCLATASAFAQGGTELKVNASVPPTYYHQVALASGFSNANGATVDLFSKTGKDIVSIPNNYVGSQESTSGDAYFGIITYYGASSLNLFKMGSGFKEDAAASYSEYLQTALPSGLSAGKEYEFSFKVSLADNAGFATSGWGIYFADAAMSNTSTGRLTVTPQITFTDMVKDKTGWVELKGKYKATGSEKFMIIGCFGKEYVKENVDGGKGYAGNKAYYYISSIMTTEVILDRDKDGILDKDDKCPDVYGLATMAGCPDTDGDGITDADDVCPAVKGLANFKGCPDGDGDGIQDSEDKCPTVAGIAANAGCPEMKVDKKAAEIFKKAMAGIQFESGKDVIKKTSYGILDNVANVLKENPTWNTTIEGHTDNVGDAAKNKDLSQRRADAVMKYLKDKSVSNGMTAIGYGIEQPIADNKTPAGRAKNRRVEFEVIYAQ